MKKKYTKQLLLCIITMSLSSMAFAQIIANGTYKIFNGVHSEVITTDTTAPYEAFMAVPNETDNFQLWNFTHQGGDVYKIVNQGSSTTLGINDGWCGQFGDVRAGFADTDANVEFKVSAADVAGTYVFEIAFTTCNFGSTNVPIKSFDIQDGNSGAQIQTFDVNTANPNQQFQIVTPGSLSTLEFSALDTVQVYYTKNEGLVIELNESLNESADIQIFDLLGKHVLSKQLLNNQNRQSIDVATLSKGFHIAVLETTSGLKKIVKFINY